MTQSILITGASGGIGLCCAVGLKKLGYSVIAADLYPNDQLVLAKIPFIKMDLRNSQSIQHCLEETLKINHGILDCLFNNAGYCQFGAIEDLSRDLIREQFETNIFGPIELTNLVIPIMKKQGYGKIIFTSSMSAFAPFPFMGSYCATKNSLEALLEAWRAELLDTNIFISLIEPGGINTNFSKAMAKTIANLNIEDSRFKNYYQKMRNETSNLNSKDQNNKIAQPPKIILKTLLKILKNSIPKSRYYSSGSNLYFLIFLKKFLPEKIFDKLMLKIMGYT